MAIISKKGSQLMRDQRERREREKAVKDQFNMAGTVIGNILGVKKEEEPADDGKRGDAQEDSFTKQAMQPLGAPGGEETGDDDGRAEARYADHMKKPNEAASEFARTKTIDEQRRFLPIYGCRQALLNVIRDNSVVVLVGETGSGKTTQIAQYLHEARALRDRFFPSCAQPAAALRRTHHLPDTCCPFATGWLHNIWRRGVHAATARRCDERRETRVRGGGRRVGEGGWLLDSFRRCHVG